MRWLILLISLMSFNAIAHEGHDHGKKDKTPDQSGKSYFTVNSSSENFELVLRYNPFKANEDAVFKLFISDFESTLLLPSASLGRSSQSIAAHHRVRRHCPNQCLPVSACLLLLDQVVGWRRWKCRSP